MGNEINCEFIIDSSPSSMPCSQMEYKPIAENDNDEFKDLYSAIEFEEENKEESEMMRSKEQ